jgi:hypothetical protein
MNSLGAMATSRTRSTRLARVFVLAFGVACFAQLTLINEWNHRGWLTFAAVIVAVPLALAFAAPRLCARGELAAHRSDVHVDWWTLAPWLFAPWALASCFLASSTWIPWNLLYESPNELATLHSVDSLHKLAYVAGLLVSAGVVLVRWNRDPLPTDSVRMRVIALTTFALTNLGGVCLVLIVWLAMSAES